MLTPDQGGLTSRYRDAGIFAELEEHGQKLRFQTPGCTGCSEGEIYRAHPLTFIVKVGGVRSFSFMRTVISFVLLMSLFADVTIRFGGKLF